MPHRRSGLVRPFRALCNALLKPRALPWAAIGYAFGAVRVQCRSGKCGRVLPLAGKRCEVRVGPGGDEALSGVKRFSPLLEGSVLRVVETQGFALGCIGARLWRCDFDEVAKIAKDIVLGCVGAHPWR